MESILFRSLAISLGLTLLVEMTGALMLGIRKGKDLLLVFLVNIVTNLPLVLTLDLVYIFHRRALTWPLIFTLESCAFLTEGILYRKHLVYRKLDPFAISLILNVISYFGGWILT